MDVLANTQKVVKSKLQTVVGQSNAEKYDPRNWKRFRDFAHWTYKRIEANLPIIFPGRYEKNDCTFWVDAPESRQYLRLRPHASGTDWQVVRLLIHGDRGVASFEIVCRPSEVIGFGTWLVRRLADPALSEPSPFSTIKVRKRLLWSTAAADVIRNGGGE